MRLSRNQAWWALGVSLFCHAAIGALFCLAFPTIYNPRAAKAGAVDCSLACAPDFPATSVRLLDAPVPVAVTEPPRELPKEVQQTDLVPAEAPAVRQVTAREPAAQTSNKVASTASGNSPGASTVLPLHGPLAKSGFRIVYVLDRSGSMAGQKLKAAVAMLKASLAQLGPDVRFQIVTYDSRATLTKIGGRLELAEASTSNVADAGLCLDELCGEGSSQHVEGLRAGICLQPDLLILLTDAGDISFQEVKQVNMLNRKGTPIHVVLIGASKSETAALRELTGPGRIHFIPLHDR